MVSIIKNLLIDNNWIGLVILVVLGLAVVIWRAMRGEL